MTPDSLFCTTQHSYAVLRLHYLCSHTLPHSVLHYFKPRMGYLTSADGPKKKPVHIVVNIPDSCIPYYIGRSSLKVCIDLHILMFCHCLFCAMLRALGVPITDYSFEDCQLAMAEGQLRLPVDTCLLEYAKLVRRLG